MKYSKKLIALILTSALLCTIAGCSGDNTSTDVSTSTQTPPTSQDSMIESTPDVTEPTEPAEPENTDPLAYENRAGEPVSLSHNGGVYSEEFELTLTAEDSAEIFYTLDGSNPLTSDTALKYDAPIKITDRADDKNVVSAVDPLEICGSFNYINKETRKDFLCDLSAPEDSAVDKCTVIRTAAKNADGSYSPEVNSTYFIGTMEEHIEGIAESCAAAGQSLAVVSIAMDYDDLFDSEKGIYVKGDIFAEALAEFLEEERLRDADTARRLQANYTQRGREWERTAAVTLMECDENGAKTMFTQNCGIRVQGNYSRSDLQKGLRLYARKDYGDNNFNGAVFGEGYLNDNGEVMDKFKTLVLRAGGNCAFLAKFNDTYWQALSEGMDIGTTKSRPCVVYLNGEYWGVYVLQEDYTDDYFEDLHGVAKEHVIIYKGDAESLELGYKLDEGELPEGVTDETYYFSDLLEFFDTHTSCESDEDYNELASLVDPESCMDYFAVECWINNKWDWPGKNWSMWRTAVNDGTEYGDGRWRYLLYDVEFGGIGGKGDLSANTIKEDNYKPKGLLDMDTSNPAVLCFAYFMTNEGFKNEFCDRLSGLSNGAFEKETALAKLKEFEGSYGPLFDQFFQRYPETGDTEGALTGGYGSAQCIRDFVNEREKHIEKQIKYVHKILG